MNVMESFLESQTRNSWIDALGYSLYVRKGKHYLDGKSSRTIDIASVQCMGIAGRFWEVVQKTGAIAACHGIEYILIENVLNETLATSLRKKQWQEIMYDGGLAPSFYVKISDLNVCHSKE